MGSSKIQGELWNHAPSDWAYVQEPQHNPLFEAMLDAAAVGEATRFLDVGCGGGGASVLAAKRGAKISGLDAAAGLVALAHERTPYGDFRVGDMEELPFADAAFDIAFAANCIQYATDHGAALREFKRVCAPGGRVIAGLLGPPEHVAFRLILDAIRALLPVPPSGAVPYELSIPGALEGLFEAAGLPVLTTGEVDCPFTYPNFDTFWRGNAAAGPFQAAIGAAGADQVMAAARAATEAFLGEDGAIQIGPNVFKYVVAQVIG